MSEKHHTINLTVCLFRQGNLRTRDNTTLRLALEHFNCTSKNKGLTEERTTKNIFLPLFCLNVTGEWNRTWLGARRAEHERPNGSNYAVGKSLAVPAWGLHRRCFLFDTLLDLQSGLRQIKQSTFRLAREKQKSAAEKNAFLDLLVSPESAAATVERLVKNSASLMEGLFSADPAQPYPTSLNNVTATVTLFTPVDVHYYERKEQAEIARICKIAQSVKHKFPTITFRPVWGGEYTALSPSRLEQLFPGVTPSTDYDTGHKDTSRVVPSGYTAFRQKVERDMKGGHDRDLVFQSPSACNYLSSISLPPVRNTQDAYDEKSAGSMPGTDQISDTFVPEAREIYHFFHNHLGATAKLIDSNELDGKSLIEQLRATGDLPPAAQYNPCIVPNAVTPSAVNHPSSYFFNYCVSGPSPTSPSGWRGGEVAAWDRIKRFVWGEEGDEVTSSYLHYHVSGARAVQAIVESQRRSALPPIVKYKLTRNQSIAPGNDYFSSKFSLWLGCGCLSARSIIEEVSKLEKVLVAMSQSAPDAHHADAGRSFDANADDMHAAAESRRRQDRRKQAFIEMAATACEAELPDATSENCIAYRDHIKKDELQAYLDSTYWLVFELLWREYTTLLSLTRGRKLFAYGGLLNKASKWGAPAPSTSHRTNDSNGNRSYHGKGNRNKSSNSGSHEAESVYPVVNDVSDFVRWTEGTTGFPLVDAAMREMKATGFMSNRCRQNVASFLVYKLGVDWRWGAEWFEHCLIDFDPGANYCNWQAVAGIGLQSRDNVFNVVTQASNYEPKATYFRRWLGGEHSSSQDYAPNSWESLFQQIPDEYVHIPWEYRGCVRDSQSSLSVGETWRLRMLRSPSVFFYKTAEVLQQARRAQAWKGSEGAAKDQRDQNERGTTRIIVADEQEGISSTVTLCETSSSTQPKVQQQRKKKSRLQ